MRCLSHSHQDNIIYTRDNIAREEKDEIVKRIGEIADGVFQFSDIHEHGGNSSLVLTFRLKEQFYRISSPHRRFEMFCLRVETIPVYWVFG